MPASNLVQGDVLKGVIDYRRRFEVDARGVQVTTTLTGDGKNRIAEFYEIIPVLRAHHPSPRQGGRKSNSA